MRPLLLILAVFALALCTAPAQAQRFATTVDRFGRTVTFDRLTGAVVAVDDDALVFVRGRGFVRSGRSFARGGRAVVRGRAAVVRGRAPMRAGRGAAMRGAGMRGMRR